MMTTLRRLAACALVLLPLVARGQTVPQFTAPDGSPAGTGDPISLSQVGSAFGAKQDAATAARAIGVTIGCDGATDNGSVINGSLLMAAFSRAPSTTVELRPVGLGDCRVATTIATPKWSGIRLLGPGDGNYGREKLRLKWTGAAGGTMLDWSSPGDGYVTASSQIGGILLDGNKLAGTALRIRNLSRSRLDLTIVNTTGWGIDSDAAPGGADVSLNVFGMVYIDQSGSTGGGWLNGSGVYPHNTNSNLYQNITIVTAGADGFVCGSMDANTFLYLRTQGPAGSGLTGSNPHIGLRMQGSTVNSTDPVTAGSCRFNTFLQAQVYGRVRIEAGLGGFPARDNTIWSLGVADSFSLVDDQVGGLNMITTDDRRTSGVRSVALQGYTVAMLPSGCAPGTTVYASNGRNNGQAAGAGTGLNVTCDSGSVWRAPWSGLAVTQ